MPHGLADTKPAMESRRFVPDPAIARQRAFVIAAVFLASGIVVLWSSRDTLADVFAGVFGAFGVLLAAIAWRRPATPDKLETVIIDHDGFTVHRPPDTNRRVAWSEVRATWPLQQHLVVKLEAGGQVLVPLFAQPSSARTEIVELFHTSLGERFTSLARQKL